MQNNLRELNAIKNAQRDKIAELVDDNKKLANLCQEQDHSLYLANQEKAKLAKKLNDDNANIGNLNSKLRVHSNNLNNLQKFLHNYLRQIFLKIHLFGNMDNYPSSLLFLLSSGF